MASRSKSHMGGSTKPKSKGKKAHHVSVHHSASGGFIVTHHKGATPDPETDEQHTPPDQASMLQNVAEAMPQQGGGGPAPMPQGGAPSPQMGM